MTEPLHVGLEEARAACLESVRHLVATAEAFQELELLEPSRCVGWSRMDLVVHLIGGWDELLRGLVSVVDAEPSTDAAAYWPAFTAQFVSDDPVPSLMVQRRRTAAYARPAHAVAELREVGEALLRGVAALDDRRLLWQGLVFEPGDYLAVWAVEHAVHHLDLLAPTPPTAAALGLTRRTVAALCGVPLPVAWSDSVVALVGAGRMPVPAEDAELAAHLPVLG